MIEFSIQLLICFIVFSSQSRAIQHDQVLHYERNKRDQSPWFYPEIDKNKISCGPNVYVKLNSCSQFTDCQTISDCLEPLHCPLTVKSFGSVIINVLRVIGISNCPFDTLKPPCSNEKRQVLLKDFYAYSKNFNDDTYCSSIVEFTREIREKIQNQCPSYLRHVEDLIENFLCSTNSTSSSTSLPDYFDEDEDWNFFNTNKNLLNNTEQTVYVNDDQYYNISYIIRKFSSLPMFFVNDTYQFSRIHALSNRHRSAIGINLKFEFPFYGHPIKKILIATGGFIYTGDVLHSALIGSTQYIAPFMANFDISIGKNESAIKYYDNGTHFICTWENVYLQDQKEVGGFSFQAILQNNGNIYFNYVQMPNVNISNENHAHRLGISDAYLAQHTTNEHIVRVITLYDKINLDKEKIRNGVSVVFDMGEICNTFTDCASCLANRGQQYNCSWCEDIQKCSDGYDRSRQQWIRAQCHRLPIDQTCPSSQEDIFDQERSASKSETSINNPRRSHSLLQIFRTITVTILLSVLILALAILTVTYIYAYRNPTSSAGMWLLEHRPSTYIARFRRFTSSN